MINIMRADFYRLIRSVGLYLMLGIFIFIDGASIVMQSPGGISIGSVPMVMSDMKLDIQQATCGFNFFYPFVMLAFMIAVSDFSHHTVKNTISSGVSRSTYFLAKFLMTELSAVVTFLGIRVLFYVVNRLVNGTEFSSPFADYMKVTMLQLPYMLAAGAVLTTLAFLLRKGVAYNAIAIAGPIIYLAIAGAIYSISKIEKLGETMLKLDMNAVCGQLVSNPDSTYVTRYIIGAVAAIVVCFVGSYVAFTRAEVK